MHRVVSVYGRKIFSVALIFNALLTISCAIGILAGFYAAYPNWKPFEPYLIDGNLFWVIVVAAVINIFPAAYFGKVHTGRLWFHHYVYGFFVVLSSAAWVILFTSVSLVSLFLINSTNITVNVGRFFMLSGMALVIDDLPDVSKFTMRCVKWLKAKAYQGRKIMHALQVAIGFLTGYFAVAVSLSIFEHPEWVTPANSILIGTLFVTAITSFGSAARKVWLKLEPA